MAAGEEILRLGNLLKRSSVDAQQEQHRYYQELRSEDSQRDKGIFVPPIREVNASLKIGPVLFL
jgi:RecB family endonuclease NucS